MATAEELFNPQKADALLIVKFYHGTQENKVKSYKESRPVFDDVEMCEINLPGDRARSIIAPAHAGWKKFDGHMVTYAERFREHYARFKANEGPIVEGTPLSEAPFLSMGDKASLKALQIYTVEQLASLTGQALKNIGHGGLVKQQQAVAYMTKANGTASVTAMQQTINDLQRQLAEAQQPKQMEPIQNTPYTGMSSDDLKAEIQLRTGTRPKGNPNQATLVAMLVELDTETAKAA